MTETAAKPTMHVIGGNERLATQIAAILEKRNGGNTQKQWDIEDAAKNAKDAASIAVRAATSAKGHYQMVASEIGEHRGSLDATNFAVKSIERKITGMQADIASSRNNCLLWGIGAGCVSAVVMSMAFAPSIPTIKTAPQVAPQVRSAGGR